MTEHQHPITPPPELVQQWFDNSPYRDGGKHIAIQAARWGADMELKACCEWVGDGRRENLSQVIALRTHRRPKPPSLAEEALEQLTGIKTLFKAAYGGDLIDDSIRIALERLQQLDLGND